MASQEGVIGMSKASSLVTALVALVVMNGRSLAVDGDCRDRLYKEAPAQWNALREFYSQIECTWTQTVVANFPKPSDTSQRKKRLLLRGDLIRIEVTDHSKGNRQGVVVVSPRHVFKVTRPSESKPFVLQYLGKTNPYPVDNELACVQAPFCYVGRTLQKWLQAPNFITKQVVLVRSRETNLVRWQCEFTPTKEEEAAEGLLPFSSTLELDPAKYWTIRSFVTVVATHKVVGSVEYGADINGFPVVKSVSVTTTNKDGREMTDTGVIESFSPRVVPDSEFTLGAFGIPEVVSDTPPRGTPLYVWLLVGAVVSGVLGYAAHRVVRQRATLREMRRS